MKIDFDNEGYQTNASIKSQIANKFGFNRSNIILLEAGYQFDVAINASFCRNVTFDVCGIDYYADLAYGDISILENHNNE